MIFNLNLEMVLFIALLVSCCFVFITLLLYGKLKLMKKELRLSQLENDDLLHTNNLMTFVLSHEIRSPLNSLHFLTDSILKHIQSHDGTIDQENIHYLQEVMNSFKCIRESIENYLVWHEADSLRDKVEKVPFALNQIIKDCLFDLQPVILKRRHHIMFESENVHVLNNDPVFTTMIVRNVLQFVTLGKDRQIRIELFQNKQNHNCISVKYSIDSIFPNHGLVNDIFTSQEYKPTLPNEIRIVLIASLSKMLGYEIQHIHTEMEDAFLLEFNH